MTDTNVIKLAQPGTFTDSLTEILRNGARALLTQAVETEVADFLERYTDLKTKAGEKNSRKPLPSRWSQAYPPEVFGRAILTSLNRESADNRNPGFVWHASVSAEQDHGARPSGFVSRETQSGVAS